MQTNVRRVLQREALNVLVKDMDLMEAFNEVVNVSNKELKRMINRKYEVLLMAHGNPDHGEDPNKMVAPLLKMQRGTIEGCQEVVSSYIEAFNLGGSNFTGGQVFWNGNEVGFVAFNGRYFENKRTIYNEDGTLLNAGEMLKQAKELQQCDAFSCAEFFCAIAN